jgi:hypothetical protein
LNLLSPLHLGRHVGAALSLLLALCAILTTVSVLQARQLGEPVAAARDPVMADAVAPVRQTMRQLDQVRGLEALHLLVKADAEMRSLEAELAAQRRAIDALLAHCQALPSDATDLQFSTGVRADFAHYWTLQDRLLATSRRALSDRAAAAQAQQLLTGASQEAFDRLRDRLDRWWTHREAHARQAAQAQRAQAAQTLWFIALLGALALGVGLALLRSLRAAGNAGSELAPAAAWKALPPDDEPAAPSRVQEIQALIDAARADNTPAPRGTRTVETGPD